VSEYVHLRNAASVKHLIHIK